MKIPTVIEKYINAANESDLKTAISCFSETATVLDEGETLSGHESIQSWFLKTRSKYDFKSRPLSCEDQGENIIVTSEVSGNFPGSPVTLSYRFQLENNLIQDLRIQ